jgi:hypothetical protein
MPAITDNLENPTVANFANDVNDDERSQPAPSAAHQALGEAVTTLRALFADLGKSYDRNTPIGRSMIMAKAVEAIEGKPTLKKQIVKAIKDGTTATIEVAVDHPVTRPVIATIKGFMSA